MQTTQEIFEDIYRRRIWGGRRFFWRKFYSGSGSANEKIIVPYVDAILPIIRGKDVVDIGCGDFFIGRRLVKSCKSYVGCDIARPLIEYNRKKFGGDFRVVDAARDPLPEGDIVLARQVLQHLSNSEVALILPKLRKYKCAIITEHLPGVSDFTPNLDKPTGAGHRVNFGSGLVLTVPPFNLEARAIKNICEVREFGGIIRTIAFEF
jgi:SAM-dependent methyltransferase